MTDHSFFALLSRKLDEHRGWRINLPAILILICAILPFIPQSEESKLLTKDYVAKAMAKQKQKAKEAKNKELVRRVEQALHVCQRDQIMAQLNDPGSYRLHDYKSVFKDDDVMMIRVDYSAKNAFGGRVRSTHTCKWNLN